MIFSTNSVYAGLRQARWRRDLEAAKAEMGLSLPIRRGFFARRLERLVNWRIWRTEQRLGVSAPHQPVDLMKAG